MSAFDPKRTFGGQYLENLNELDPEATASLAENAQPWIFIDGAGDDCGVGISVRVPDDANVPSCPEVDLHVPRGAKRGHDACAMVRALRDIPGWRQIVAI